MENVLFITDLHTGSHVIEIAGVFERAVSHGWRVIEIERDRTTRPLGEFAETWKPAGCIMECGKLSEPIDVSGLGGVPIVYLDPDPVTLATARFVVTNDSEALARRAVAELEKAKPVHYAYVGWCRRTSWSAGRGEAFVREVKAAGGQCSVYEKPWQDTVVVQKDLCQWLGSLPKPVGIFAANDYAAEQVCGACQLAGFQSPQDVLIVGVDNDELLCENTFPSLTSVEPDFKTAGRISADLLAEAIANPSLERRHLSFGPLAVHRRQSTRTVNTGDYRIVRAVELIRRDACIGLTAADVIKSIGLSRRLAEKRFLEATGRTILGEIQEVRMEMAKRLLRDETVPIGHIAGRCGWESDSYLKRFFKKRTGMTPREWRRSQKGQ